MYGMCGPPGSQPSNLLDVEIPIQLVMRCIWTLFGVSMWELKVGRDGVRDVAGCLTSSFRKALRVLVSCTVECPRDGRSWSGNVTPDLTRLWIWMIHLCNHLRQPHPHLLGNAAQPFDQVVSLTNGEPSERPLSSWPAEETDLIGSTREASPEVGFSSSRRLRIRSPQDCGSVG